MKSRPISVWSPELGGRGRKIGGSGRTFPSNSGETERGFERQIEFGRSFCHPARFNSPYVPPTLFFPQLHPPVSIDDPSNPRVIIARTFDGLN